MIETENIGLNKVNVTASTNDFEAQADSEEEYEREEYYIEDGWGDTFNKKQRGWSWIQQDDRNYGKCQPFLYYNGEPLIVIGPDCRIC